MTARDTSARDRVRNAVAAGIRDAVLVIVAYIPFGLALGLALASTRVDPLLALLSSPIIFAGASQLVAVQLLDAGAGIALVVATVAVVNARHLLYSAALVPYLADWSRGLRMFGSFFLADPVYALVIARYERPAGGGPRPERIAYFFAVGVSCLVGWTALTTAGIFLGGLIPAWIPLELAIPLTFLLLVLPLIKNSAGVVAAAVGGVVALAAAGLPLGLGLIAGAAAGLAAGGVVLARTDKPEVPDA
jgi:predicted branched-subunit amino acid permease